jgi:outer membrane protein assembly factor BamA
MKQFSVFVAVFILVCGLSAQESASNDMRENQITAISVLGLKKTKLHIIERPLEKFIGRNAADVDINEVIAIIQSSGILEPLSVEIMDSQESSGKTLVVAVREKWSILPIPVFSIGSSGWTVGGALMDTNAFGLKDNMMIMGSYGTGGWMANVMFLDPPDGTGDFGWNVMGMFSFLDKENTDQTGEQTVRRYDSISINPSIGLSYKLTEFVTPSMALAYRGVILRDTKDPVNAPEKNFHGISISPDISMQHNTWDGYFLNESSVSLKYNYILAIDADDVHSAVLRAALNQSIIPGLRFIAKTGIAFATPSASPFFESSPMSVGANVLPQKYSALNIASGSLGLEKYLLNFSFGTISVGAAYEAIYSGGELLHRQFDHGPIELLQNHQFDHGPVAMLQMYLNRIAIPGIGLGAAYNVDKKVWQYAFNIGATF